MDEAIAFDTHRFVKNLTASGFTEAQAEALADEQVHLLNSNLATRAGLAAVKSDLEVKMEQLRTDLEVKMEQVRTDLEVKIEQVKSDLEVKIEQVKSDLEVKIEQVRADILKWMITAMTAQTALLATLIRYW